MIDPLSRVPFFMFQDREHGVNVEASKEAGYEVPKLMTFILIAPHGHKGDPQEFFADEFMARKETEAKKNMYNMSWVTEFKAGLALYRDGKAIPRHGTPLITWERILKSRRTTLAVQYPTIEDLAAVPDSALGEIGMDGRVLRDYAKFDLQAKKDLSPIVKELAEALETIRRMQEQNDKQAVHNEKLMARLDALEDSDMPRRGRPRKETAEA